MEPSWSLHLLSEILSAFSTEDPENPRNVVNRVAEAFEVGRRDALEHGADGRLHVCGAGEAEDPPQLSRAADWQLLYVHLGRDVDVPREDMCHSGDTLP